MLDESSTDYKEEEFSDEEEAAEEENGEEEETEDNKCKEEEGSDEESSEQEEEEEESDEISELEGKVNGERKRKLKEEVKIEENGNQSDDDIQEIIEQKPLKFSKVKHEDEKKDSIKLKIITEASDNSDSTNKRARKSVKIKIKNQQIVNNSDEDVNSDNTKWIKYIRP